jgi:ABC-type transporter Mla MlaB component
MEEQILVAVSIDVKKIQQIGEACFALLAVI